MTCAEREQSLLEFEVEGLFVFVDEMLFPVKRNDGSNMFDRLCGILDEKIHHSKRDSCRREIRTCPPCSVNEPLSFD